MSAPRKTCPHCGALLPQKAHFCPHCAQKIALDRSLTMPPLHSKVRRRRRMLALALLTAVFLCAGAAAVLPRLLSSSAQKTYEGAGEVIYPSRDGDFYLTLGTVDTQEQPTAQQTFYLLPGYEAMGKVPLFVHYAGSGEDVSGLFFRRLKHFSTEFIPEEGRSISCADPYEAPTIVPGSALVCDVSLQGEAGQGQLIWHLEMDNGDTIRLSQHLTVEMLPTRSYHWQDYPMETMEQLQEVVKQAEQETAEGTVIQLTLPSVTYTGTLELSRPLCIYGSQEGETVFQGSVRLLWEGGPDCYFHDLTFRSSGGTGLSSKGHLHLNRCTFSGFDTGLLAEGTGTLYTSDCLFTQNDVAIHLAGSPPKRRILSFYQTQFLQNSTGLLLDLEPLEVPIDLYGSVFRGNQQDIQNLKNQSLELSNARFF